MQIRECVVYVGLRADWRPAQTKAAPVCEECIAQQRDRGVCSEILSVGEFVTANQPCRFCRGHD